MQWVRRFLLGLLGLLILGVIGFTVWALNPPPPMANALSALQSDTVVVNTDRWLEFTPTAVQPTIGVIFYPGGRVDPRAYAPAAQAIAAQGYYVAIVPMLFNLAIFSPNRADDVIAAQPTIQQWVIGGHSLGGAMAANYAYNHAEKVAGLFLWASYPADNNSLGDRAELAVTSIYGRSDGLISAADIEQSTINLPPQTAFVAIEGGNHAQFGWYGDQSGDAPATISREEQQQQAVAATLRLLAAIPTH